MLQQPGTAPAPKLSIEELRKLLDDAVPGAEELGRSLKKVFRLPGDDLILDAGKATSNPRGAPPRAPVALPKEEVAPPLVEHRTFGAPVPLPEKQLPKEGPVAAPAPGDAGCRKLSDAWVCGMEAGHAGPCDRFVNATAEIRTLLEGVSGGKTFEDFVTASLAADPEVRRSFWADWKATHDAELARVRSEEREHAASLIDSFVNGLLLEARQTRTLAVQIEQRRIAERLAALAALIENVRPRASDATSAGGGPVPFPEKPEVDHG